MLCLLVVVESLVTRVFNQRVALGHLIVCGNHLPHELIDRYLRFPTQDFLRFGRIAKQCLYFGRAEIALIYGDDLVACLPVNADLVQTLARPLDVHVQLGATELDEFAKEFCLPVAMT